MGASILSRMPDAGSSPAPLFLEMKWRKRMTDSRDVMNVFVLDCEKMSTIYNADENTPSG